jgi:hypothetical protein
LVVGRIELDLIIIHEDERTLLMRRRTYSAFLRQGRRDRHRRGAAEDYSTRELPAPPRPVQVHGFLPDRIARSQHAIARSSAISAVE